MTLVDIDSLLWPVNLNFSDGNNGVRDSNGTLSLIYSGSLPFIFSTSTKGKYLSPYLGGLTIPLIVSRNYNIPKWANKHTLVIVSSYSGDTEETLSAFDDALLKECQIIGITTGGALLKQISSNNLDHIIMPKGLQPRAALAYSFVPMLYLFLELGLIEMDLHDESFQEAVLI